MATVTKRPWTYNGVTKTAWAVRYLDPATGKRPSKQFETKKEADAFKRKVEREIEDGQHISPAAQLTMGAAAVKYSAYLAMRLEDGQIGRSHHDRERIAIDRWMLPILGKMKMKDVTSEDALRVYRNMVGAGLKPATIKQFMFSIKMMELWARAPSRRYTTSNAFHDAMKEIRVPRTKPVRTFTAEQVALLLNVAGDRGHNREPRTAALLACFVGLAALCGLRVGEIMALAPSDVDLDNRLIRVGHNMTAWGVRKDPKTVAGERTVSVPDRMVQPLQYWIDHHAVANERGLLFTRRRGTPIGHSGFRSRWNDLLQRCGISDDGEGYHFHALRHFHASWLLKHHIPATDVAKLMGHANAAVTLSIYSHALLQSDELRGHINRTASLLIDAREPQRLLSA